MQGGIYWLKQHVAHEGKNVTKCKAGTPEALEAKEKCKKALNDAKRKSGEKTVCELELREEVNVSRVGGGESEEVTCIGSSEPHKLEPIDKWARAIDPKATKSESFTQQKLNKELWKERTHEVHKYIARWVYTHAIPFNACDNDEFKQMVEAIGQFGAGLKPPTQYDLRERLLEEEYARTKSLLQEREAEKLKNGCSIMTDAWSDRKRRSIMNLCTNCADGTSFISSKEMLDVSHTNEVIFELVDKAIEDIGPDNVVQVVTNNASNNMGAKKLLLEKRPQIFWTSCATHTINLMLQEISNMARFKKVIDQAKTFTIFVYGHTRTLECLRYFTEEKEIIRSGVTRFASTFLTLNSIQEKKDQLRKMVVHILHLVDGDVKPSMGFVYGKLLKAKREIKEAFGNNESWFKELINKKEKIKSKKISDVLLSNDTTEAQGFLHENGDDCALVVYRDEEDEMEGTGISWSVIGGAVGVEEQLELCRSARVRQFYEGEEFDSEEEQFDEDKDDYVKPY
ncbi:unnamed protein product [Miscanthus lutarioriparius]|uniref:DUF659 domain-containing protein n=1 Tax=Miscanthus lutarioriparius TaxID=422564 RepID=A0A811NKP8_9POAL|nr:unnamed protein product [Miscanthus lutarioriparius]